MDLSPMLYDAAFYSDQTVQENDVLVVPFKQYFVSVAGAVLKPGRYPYVPDRTYDYYIGLAGGGHALHLLFLPGSGILALRDVAAGREDLQKREAAAVQDLHKLFVEIFLLIGAVHILRFVQTKAGAGAHPVVVLTVHEHLRGDAALGKLVQTVGLDVARAVAAAPRTLVVKAERDGLQQLLHRPAVQVLTHGCRILGRIGSDSLDAALLGGRLGLVIALLGMDRGIDPAHLAGE